MRGERGAAAVELALVLPLLLAIIFGIIDAGRAFDSQLVIDRAASYGARLAALGRDNPAPLVQAAAAGAGPVTVTITACPGWPIQQGNATVTVTGLLSLGLPGLPRQITITSTAVQPCEP